MMVAGLSVKSSLYMDCDFFSLLIVHFLETCLHVSSETKASWIVMTFNTLFGSIIIAWMKFFTSSNIPMIALICLLLCWWSATQLLHKEPSLANSNSFLINTWEKPSYSAPQTESIMLDWHEVNDESKSIWIMKPVYIIHSSTSSMFISIFLYHIKEHDTLSQKCGFKGQNVQHK